LEPEMQESLSRVLKTHIIA